MPNSLRHTDLTPLHAWLIEAGTNDVAAETLFDGFCGRLVAAGVPIARGFLSIVSYLLMNGSGTGNIGRQAATARGF